MPNLFHDYPLPPDRHPEHVNWTDLAYRLRMTMPVWTGTTSEPYLRDDEMRAWNLEDMARLDLEFPMPRPPVLVGQVWRVRGIVDGSGSQCWEFKTIVARIESESGKSLMWFNGGTEVILPPLSDLVWGPHAPWQDTRKVGE